MTLYPKEEFSLLENDRLSEKLQTAEEECVIESLEHIRDQGIVI